MKFKEYALQRERQEIIKILSEHDIHLEEEQIQELLEAGWLNKAKGGLAKGALLASIPFAMSANWKDTQPHPYHFHGDRIMANQQHLDDESADKAYTNAGGPKFKQTMEDAEKFLQFRSSPKHAEALEKAGLPRNYIPSPIRSFVYGEKISTAEESNEESVEVFKGEIRKVFGRDSFVSIVQTKDAVTGGAVLLVKASGVVMATDQMDAVRRAEVMIKEIARNKGFEVDGFRNLHDPDISVKLAPRSTVDLASEATGRPFRFSVEFKIVPRRNESVKNESLRTHSERNPFARETVVGRPVEANGKTCDWCGSEGKNGKLYQYTVEGDGGRNMPTKGIFCCKNCFKAYNS